MQQWQATVSEKQRHKTDYIRTLFLSTDGKPRQKLSATIKKSANPWNPRNH